MADLWNLLHVEVYRLIGKPMPKDWRGNVVVEAFVVANRLNQFCPRKGKSPRSFYRMAAAGGMVFLSCDVV